MRKTVSMNCKRSALNIYYGFSSSVDERTLFGRHFYIKRDDVVTSPGQCLTGNKLRKLHYLLSVTSNKPVYASYGGIQSNSMVAISHVALTQKKLFLYFTKTIPKLLKSKPNGNYETVLNTGAQCIELSTEDYNQLADATSHSEAIIKQLTAYNTLLGTTFSASDVHWIPQGAASPMAKVGVTKLAEELEQFINSKNDSTIVTNKQTTDTTKWKIIISSGTGTTALFIAQYFRNHSNVEVLAIPCAGSEKSLMTQMVLLDRETDNLEVFPTILSVDNSKSSSLGTEIMRPKRIFAKPYSEHLVIWNYLCKKANMQFDLIYAPRSFETMIQCCCASGMKKDHSSSVVVIDSTDSGNSDLISRLQVDTETILKDWLPGTQLIYYHCGGIEGNDSQLERYKILK